MPLPPTVGGLPRDLMALQGRREESHVASHSAGVGGREISARLAGSLRGLGAEQGGSWACPGLRVRALGRSGEGGEKQRPLSFEAPSKEKCKPRWVIPVWSWRVREGRG